VAMTRSRPPQRGDGIHFIPSSLRCIYIAWYGLSLPRRHIHRRLRELARKHGRTIWVFALTVAYQYIPGSESDAFKAIGVFTGLMISLGSAGLQPGHEWSRDGLRARRATG
jgi:hypothetical protein